MMTQTKNSCLSARAILYLMFCLLMALTVVLPFAAESVYAEAKNSVVTTEVGTLAFWKWATICAPIISAIAVCAAAWIAGKQFIVNKRLYGLQFVLQTLKEIVSDEGMQRTLYEIESCTTSEEFNRKVKAPELDRLLGHLAGIAIARDSDAVKDDDLFVAKYYVCTTMDNPFVKAYVDEYLEIIGKRHKGVQAHPYRVLMGLRVLLEEKFPERPVPPAPQKRDK